jgi:hypothetical protein
MGGTGFELLNEFGELYQGLHGKVWIADQRQPLAVFLGCHPFWNMTPGPVRQGADVGTPSAGGFDDSFCPDGFPAMWVPSVVNGDRK